MLPMRARTSRCHWPSARLSPTWRASPRELTPFDDSDLAAGGVNPISRFDWRSGYWINYIQLSYGGKQGDMHGTDAGGSVFPGVALANGERITSAVRVWTNVAPAGVARLEFTTNIRTFVVGADQPLNDPGAYRSSYLAIPAKPSSCTNDGEARLIAIRGWVNGWLTGISFVWAWQKADPCSPNPCGTGATCTPSSDGKQFACTCPSGKTYSAASSACINDYVGCYKDDTTALVPFKLAANDATMTNEKCESMARAYGGEHIGL
ncbi:hypothetical protein HYH03_011338 [Edaphochlamys debaryana]|uniref:EGF-like domain-containing protein n=1 Tax=Edaphochlamys debaryana TaxID=47281 RepID=A0A836BV32_9CHLO|nr:hypothetical protein HYH03_011338 [Edaphochlamys debaryana]|eukprot:KAG2490211.1 hypothetical protein HYH03_011338 [Edaphochlamys debaryana]